MLTLQIWLSDYPWPPFLVMRNNNSENSLDFALLTQSVLKCSKPINADQLIFEDPCMKLRSCSPVVSTFWTGSQQPSRSSGGELHSWNLWYALPMLLLFLCAVYAGICDSVLGKRVLTYWENRGTSGYSYMNAVLVPMEYYTFLERWDLPLSKNMYFSITSIKTFIWL